MFLIDSEVSTPLTFIAPPTLILKGRVIILNKLNFVHYVPE
jgi:hypothetical protein